MAKVAVTDKDLQRVGGGALVVGDDVASYGVVEAGAGEPLGPVVAARIFPGPDDVGKRGLESIYHFGQVGLVDSPNFCRNVSCEVIERSAVAAHGPLDERHIRRSGNDAGLAATGGDDKLYSEVGNLGQGGRRSIGDQLVVAEQGAIEIEGDELDFLGVRESRHAHRW